MTEVRTEQRAAQCARLIAATTRIAQLSAMADTSRLLGLWRAMFTDEIDLVQRARNNVIWQHPISASNLAAAATMAEKIVGLGEEALDADRAKGPLPRSEHIRRAQHLRDDPEAYFAQARQRVQDARS